MRAGRSISYGDIVARGNLGRSFTPEQLKEIPIKTASHRRLIGRDTLALDVHQRSTARVATASMPWLRE